MCVFPLDEVSSMSYIKFFYRMVFTKNLIKYGCFKNSIFKNYSVYVDKNFKIVSIAGMTELYEQNLSKFENKCRNKKK